MSRTYFRHLRKYREVPVCATLRAAVASELWLVSPVPSPSYLKILFRVSAFSVFRSAPWFAWLLAVLFIPTSIYEIYLWKSSLTRLQHSHTRLCFSNSAVAAPFRRPLLLHKSIQLGETHCPSGQALTLAETSSIAPRLILSF